MKAKAIKLFLFSLMIFGASLATAQAKKHLEYSGFFDSYYFRGPWSITGNFGTALYDGDLGTFSESNKFTPSFGLGVAYKPWPRVRFGFQIGIQNFDVEDIDTTRGLSMTGNLNEFMFYGKYYIIEDIVRNHTQFRKDKLKPVKPFVTLGFAPVFYGATLKDTLNETSTTSGISLVVPFGGGIQVDFTHRMSVSLDLVYRYTFTDNIDNFKNDESGGTSDDSYATIGFTVQYSPFAKRSKPKKFRAPKDAAEHHYNTGGGSDSTKATPEQSRSGDPNEGVDTYQNNATEDTIEETPVEQTEESDTSQELYEEESSEESDEDTYEDDNNDESSEEEDDYYEEEEYDEDSSDDDW